MMTFEKMLLVKKMNLQMSKQNYLTGNLERAKKYNNVSIPEEVK